MLLVLAQGDMTYKLHEMDPVRKIKLLVADDHRVLLDGLVNLLGQESNFEIAGIAGNGNQVIELLNKVETDLCLLDISMPEMDGLTVARWIREHKPSVKIIILTTHDEEEIIAETVHAGVSGYLFKSSTRQELVEAINRVMSGKMYFSEAVNTAIMQGFKQELDKKKHPEETITLTAREKEIVRLLAREFTNDRIAAELNISYRTVETHRKNIMQKTKAHNLAGLLKFAYTRGLIGSE
jgi:DNA-binding NarL/FixJ family response regulator